MQIDLAPDTLDSIAQQSCRRIIYRHDHRDERRVLQLRHTVTNTLGIPQRLKVVPCYPLAVGRPAVRSAVDFPQPHEAVSSGEPRSGSG